jgi:hypothetical protein
LKSHFKDVASNFIITKVVEFGFGHDLSLLNTEVQRYKYTKEKKKPVLTWTHPKLPVIATYSSCPAGFNLTSPQFLTHM